MEKLMDYVILFFTDVVPWIMLIASVIFAIAMMWMVIEKTNKIIDKI